MSVLIRVFPGHTSFCYFPALAPIKNQQSMSFCFSFSQALEVLSHIQCAEAFTIYEVFSVIEEIREKLQNQVGCRGFSALF